MSAINGRHADADAAQVQKEIESIGRKCIFVAADIARASEVDRLVRETEAALGGIEVLVHSAGGASLGSIDECSPEQWMATFDVHVHAAYYLCRAALPTMRRGVRARSS